jgi:membrane protein required for beta-lactamase induction
MTIGAASVLFAMAFCYFQLVAFRTRYQTLRDETDMGAFKRLASMQMYVSLVGLYAAWLPLVVWLLGKFVFGNLSWLDGVLYVLVPFVVQFTLAAASVGTAKAVRRTAAASDAIAAERDRVADVWVNKNLPEWQAQRLPHNQPTLKPFRRQA